ncbi:MAG: thioredoxin family protein [Pyrinomonadaceae bacterium]|nr:thioredoxin family protein [Pyrinomonadaceae bacterium]
MKKRYLFTFALAISLFLAALSGMSIKATGAEGGSEPGAVGSVVADFKLPDVDGKEHSLSSLKGKNGTALIFIGVQCPVSNAYNERMEKLAQDYKARGINVIGINANSTESVTEVKAHASSHNLTFTILKDNGNKIADALGAGHTPEAYLLDTGNKIVYRGRIDNARNSASVTSSELRDAMEAVLAGKPVAKSSVPAFGCSIKRG